MRTVAHAIRFAGATARGALLTRVEPVQGAHPDQQDLSEELAKGAFGMPTKIYLPLFLKEVAQVWSS